MDKLSLEEHHAYFLPDQDKDTLAKLYLILKNKMDFDVAGNPDYWFEEVETFGIEESRRLKAVHLKKALGDKKVFIVRTKFMTNEAQNALLKILEDPLPKSFFFILMPSEEYILPTLLSRLMIVRDRKETADKAGFDSKSFDAGKFLALTPPGRIKYLSEIINSKDKDGAAEIVNLLEAKVRKSYYPEYEPEAVNALNILLESRKYLHSRGASLKIILENLSLIMPKISK